MKKIFLAITILFYTCVSISPSQSVAKTWTKDEIQKLQETVVVIYSMYEETESMGSGVFISEDGKILTAAHVVDNDPKTVVIQTKDQSMYACDIIAFNDTIDLAVLQVSYSLDKFPYVQIGHKDSISSGMAVLILGHPDGHFFSSSVGVITSVVFSLAYRCVIGETDALILPGSSGGPVFSEEHQLVGIVSAMYIDMFGSPTGMGIFIGPNAINYFLEYHGIRGELAYVK